MRKGEDFYGGGKRRRAATISFFSPLLKPPLEVLETFGGAKVSDDDQLKMEQKIQKTEILKWHFLKIKHSINTPYADSPVGKYALNDVDQVAQCFPTKQARPCSFDTQRNTAL